HAYAGLPLMAGDRTLGVLAIVFGERGEFSVEEKELMQRLADHAAFTIVRSEAREQAERDRARLEVLYAVSRRLASVHDVDGVLNAVVNEAARLLGLEAAGIRLLEGEDLVISARTAPGAQLMARPTLHVGAGVNARPPIWRGSPPTSRRASSWTACSISSRGARRSSCAAMPRRSGATTTAATASSPTGRPECRSSAFRTSW